MALHHDDLVDPALHAHTHSQIDADNSIQYYIHNSESSLILGGHQISTLEHRPESEQFINNTLHQLDSLIELDLTRTEDPDTAEIRIYSVLMHSGWGQNTVGQVIPHDKGWSTLWKKTSASQSLSDFDANTIIHELGHAFGLSHPGGSGNDQQWTTEDTVMSYNVGPEGWNDTFSTSDRHALVHLWGMESDPVHEHQHTHAPNKEDGPNALNRLALAAPEPEPAPDDSDWTKGSFSQFLQGDSRASEHVVGTSDNDVLVFGEGRDRLRGSSGSDLFLIPDSQRFTARTADQIMDFNGDAGDVISVVTQVPNNLETVNFATAASKKDFRVLEENETTVIHDAITNQLVHDMNAASPGLGDGGRFAELKDVYLKNVESKKQLKKLSRTDANIIYFQAKGELFYDANGSEQGLGGDGGLIAKLKGQPNLDASHLRLWGDVMS